MRRNNYPLRLRPSLMEEARKVADSEGVALNQLFNVAVAEKLAALRTEKRFPERIRRADRSEALQILDLAGIWIPPMEGDELLTGGLQVQHTPTADCASVGESAEEKGKAFGRATPQFGQLKRRLERTGRH
jgi:hypothetical protein